MPNKIAGFTLNSSEKNHLTSEIFVAQPDSLKERLAGKLFALFEIEGKRSEALRLSDFLVDSLNRNYYEDEKVLLREKLDNLKIENIFEAVLSKVNQETAEFIEEEKIKLEIRNLNITVGVAFNNEIYFTHTGHNHCFVIYKKEDKYETLKVSQDKPEENVILSFDKLFTSVISGDIPPGSFFILSNEALAEYISSETLKEIITVLPPISATEQIKNRLKQINTYVPFSGIIIKNTFGQTETESITDSQGSIASLQHTEEKTAKILSSAGIINSRKIKKACKFIINKIKPKKKDPAIIVSKREEMPIPQSLAPTIVPKPTKNKRPSLDLKEKFFFKKKEGYMSWLKKLSFVTFLSNPKHWKNWGKKIQTLTPFKLAGKNRAIFAVLTILIIVFLVNLGITNYRHKQQEKKQVYNEATTAIEQKQNQIDSYLLYSNEEAAKTLLQQTRDLITALPQDKQYQKENHAKYLEKSDSQSTIVRRVITTKPQEIVTLPSNAEDLDLINGKLYASSANDKKLYLIDPEQKSLESLDINQKINHLDFPSVDRYNNLYYLNGSNLIQILLPEKELSTINFDLPENHGEISAMASYLNNFYLADKDKGQVYKYSKTATGVKFAGNWIKNPEDLPRPIDLAIDGDIYFLNSSGEISKFHRNAEESTANREEFNIDSIEPVVTQADKLLLTDSAIYIFEPTQKRLIKFIFTDTEKQYGDFKAQYQLELDNLQDVIVEEDSNKAYILASNKIYSINLNTLK